MKYEVAMNAFPLCVNILNWVFLLNRSPRNTETFSYFFSCSLSMNQSREFIPTEISLSLFLSIISNGALAKSCITRYIWEKMVKRRRRLIQHTLEDEKGPSRITKYGNLLPNQRRMLQVKSSKRSLFC